MVLVHMQDTRRVTYYPSDLKYYDEWRRHLYYFKTRCSLAIPVGHLCDQEYNSSQAWPNVNCSLCLKNRSKKEPDYQPTKANGYPELLISATDGLIFFDPINKEKITLNPDWYNQNVDHLKPIKNTNWLTKLFSWYNLFS